MWTPSRNPAGPAPARAALGRVAEAASRNRDLPVLAAAAVAGGLVAASAYGPPAVAVAVLLAALVVMPARWLPALAFLLFLTPFDRGPEIPSAVRAAMISLPLVVYYVRRRSRLSWSFGMTWAASWLVVVGVLSAVQGLRPGPSLAFLVPVLVLVAVPLSLRAVPAEDQRILVRTWAWSAIVLAVYGAVEFAAARNLLDPWYALSVSPLVQKWDTYRITTTIGHPLLNGMFFAASFSLFCWQLLDRSMIGKRTAVVGALAALAGTALSGSLSALIAMGVGGIVVSLAATSRHPAHVKWAIRIVLPLGLVSVFAYLSALRLGGAEADSSLDSRRDVYGAAAELIDQRPLLGAGPGYAWEQNELYGGFPDLPLESSMLELLVGWGIVGTAAVLGVVAAYMVAAVRRGRAVALAPVAAITASSLFFNFIEGDSKGMLLVCSALLVAAVPRPEPHPAPPLPRVAPLVRPRPR